jgi:DNA-binding PadR family transcriptional regulator
MTTKDLTDSESLVLGLVAEMPRHGYELEQVIEERGMREWTQIGFSSIYYVLGRLEQRGLVKAGMPANATAKKSYEITARGKETLVDQTLATLKSVQPTYPSLLLGMIHWSVLTWQKKWKDWRASTLSNNPCLTTLMPFSNSPWDSYKLRQIGLTGLWHICKPNPGMSRKERNDGCRSVPRSITRIVFAPERPIYPGGRA